MNPSARATPPTTSGTTAASTRVIGPARPTDSGGAADSERFTEPGRSTESEGAGELADRCPDDAPGDHIAVVGMACRLPGAANPAAFWELLIGGRSAIGPPPAGRAEALGAATRPGVMATAGYLDAVEEFDAALFALSPREARATDPQQRLLLELCWEAFDDAGIRPDAADAPRTGVFVGATAEEYGLLLRRAGTPVGHHHLTGTNRGFLANRLSHFFGLSGPSMTLDTGQSSALVAVHAACESIRSGESSLAVAGGVQLNLSEEGAEAVAGLGVLSPDAACFTFDARANGFVRGEGGGLVVLKPLARAVADGDRIHGVIRGTAVNNDGPAPGLTTPSARAQARAVRAACRRAGVAPGAVDYVELHGTGTPVGDPIEAEALGAAYGSQPRDAPLLVGSVKTNIGHLEGAAGIAGLLKTLLAVGHRTLPPSLNHLRPHPAIDTEAWQLKVVTEPTAWPRAEGRPVLAGVSSFGAGGTNAHVVVESPPARDEAGPDRSSPPPYDDEPETDTARAGAPTNVWVLSGHTEAALRAQAQRLADHVEARPELSAADVGHTLTAARTPLTHRAAAMGRDRDELITALRTLADGQPAGGVVRGVARPVADRAVFVFPGQGSQWTGMAERLLMESPVFAAALLSCEQALAPWVDWSLRDVLRGAEGAPSMERTDVNQPVLWAVMVALAEVWRSSGIEPAAVVGQSQGEVAAACVAGALSLADGARLIAIRSQLTAEHLTGVGGMVWVGLAAPEVRSRLAPWEGRVSVAVVSGPESVVIAGDRAALEEIVAAWEPDTRVRRVEADYASHTAAVEPLEDELITALAPLCPRASRVPFHSTVTGGPLDGTELGAAYWYRNLREPVDLQGTLRALLATDHDAFIEISPHPILLSGVRDCAFAEDRAVVAVPTLRRGEGGWGRFLTSLAELHTQGVPVPWDRHFPGARRVPLPSYAFQRERHWVGDTDAPARPPAPARDRTDVVLREIATVLGVSDPTRVDRAASFKDLGFDSAMLVELTSRLDSAVGHRLTSATLFNHPTPERLIAHLGDGPVLPYDAPTSPTPTAPAGVTDATDDPVVVVGIGCRYPGGIDSPESFWNALEAGADLVTPAPDDRGWSDEVRGFSGGFLPDAALFDAGFFGISSREALAMDPQQRLLLETSWEALERAGINPAALQGADTGVFFGAMAQEYGSRMQESSGDTGGYTLTGTSPSVLSGRISYVLGLQGPAVTIDTACSSSLVALHMAAQSVRSGECSTALAGGVTVMAGPGVFVEFSRQGGLSPDGRCKSFADGADGTGWAEGVGVLVLQRLSDAVREGREVLAVVRGSAVNQDGASNGLTAPNGLAQEQVIRRALMNAGLAPSEVDAVEAHGTGTVLGDPIEAQALLATYGQERELPLWLGSVKSNLGHTQAAAGVTGVIKVILALHHGLLPRTLHVDQPSERVDWTTGKVELLTEPVPWETKGRPRRAGVSSFGISGTNAHLVVEEAPTARPASPPRPGGAGLLTTDPHGADTPPLVVSGRTATALATQAARLTRHLDSANTTPAAVARSLIACRPLRDHRAVAFGADSLRSLAEGRPDQGVVAGVARDAGRSVLVFPGQGAQWAGMGRELWETEPAFAARMEECAAALAPHVEWSLRDVVYGTADAPGLDRVNVVQPVSFAVMVSLAALWNTYGFQPDAVIGHSQGEIAAACVAGALTLHDAAKIVTLRSQVIAEQLSGKGGMLSIALPPDTIDLPEGVEIAAVNGPHATVLAGDTTALDALEHHHRTHNTRVRRIPVDYASHSAHVDTIAPRLNELLADISSRTPTIPWYSTVDVNWLHDPVDPHYWTRNLRSRVQFADAITALCAQGFGLFIESSAHPTLAAAIADIADAAGTDTVVCGSLRRDDGGLDRFTRSLAEAFVAGAPIDWTSVLPPAPLTALPTSAFERRRFWLTPDGSPLPDPAATTSEGASDRADSARREPPQLNGVFVAAERERLLADLTDLVRREAAIVLGEPGVIPAKQVFKEAGFDSLTSVDLRTRLNAALGMRLPATVAFDFPTAALLAAHLHDRVLGTERKGPTAALASSEPVAVVGMGVRLPGGVGTPAEFWELLSDGRDVVGGFPTDRGWDLERLYDPDPDASGTTYTRHGGFLADAGAFDAAFFGISPREALAMDPQQRLLLETIWEALEDAGIDPTSLRGQQTGVFVGATPQSYGPSPLTPGNAEGHLLTGTQPSVISGRVSYVLGVEGPAVTVDTACSSSLVALHMAAQSVRSGECSMALAGGVTVMATPDVFVEFSRQRGLSPDGRCKSFAEGADGTGWAEGVGVLVLQRLSDAVRDGRDILAVVRGSAVNQDGASNGLTTPNGPAQQKVIRQALANAGLTPAEVDAVEAHGTGTSLGDPIEAEALLATYGQERDQPLHLGSVKSNIGHAQAAAGVTGVIKMILALRHELLPRTLHVDQPSSLVEWEGGQISLLTEPVPWEAKGRPRRAAVSSFGVSGTNAHIVIEEPPADAALTAPEVVAGPVPLVLSARSAVALKAQAERLADHLESTGATPAAVARSLATTRTTSWEWRAVVIAEDTTEAVKGLRGLTVPTAPASGGGVGWVFAGQGAQWPGMGQELYETYPVYAEAFDAACAELDQALAGSVPCPVKDVVFAPADSEKAALLRETVFTQAGLFAVEVAMATLVTSWGLRPTALLGHSIGEISAAHIAGIMSLKDAAQLVAARGRLIQSLPSGGTMIAIRVSEHDIQPLLTSDVSIAAINGPTSLVLSGPHH
ncbi:beta-ketoacyl synthase N-terminal-like domain-containing protein, partial [Streptomyces sp. NPDC020965]|uniref:beta-ketoacyl synthase N-terminal-like domain-containing protein n=1 Tax=Streptomyces sp. NPDC020965 TaxID=3365105 RepID=UPI00379EC771